MLIILCIDAKSNTCHFLCMTPSLRPTIPAGGCHHCHCTDESSEVSSGLMTCMRSLEHLASTKLSGLKSSVGPLTLAHALGSSDQSPCPISEHKLHVLKSVTLPTPCPPLRKPLSHFQPSSQGHIKDCFFHKFLRDAWLRVTSFFPTFSLVCTRVGQIADPQASSGPLNALVAWYVQCCQDSQIQRFHTKCSICLVALALLSCLAIIKHSQGTTALFRQEKPLLRSS